MSKVNWFWVILIGMLRFEAGASATNNALAPAAQFKSNLPVLLLEAKQPIVPERKAPCTLEMIASAGSTGATGIFSGVVRIHGGVSQGYDKKSYGITLNTRARWLGMHSSRHWVLNAAFVDRSLMRHKLAYDLFRSLSAPGRNRYSAESRFVEVFLNGKYNGAYLLMERVDRALLELRSYHSNDPIHSCIYKAVDHSANFRQPGHPGYEQHEPSPTKPYWRPLDEFDGFVSSSSDAEFFDREKGIATRLDIGNAIDFQLLVLLTSNLDGITKNFILARDGTGKTGAKPRFFFAPWDYDGTFGRNWDATRVEPTVWLSNHLFDRLHGAADFRRRFGARWQQLRKQEFAIATIHRLIDDNARTLGDAARRNAERWHTLEGPYPDRLTFEEDVAQMKEWVTARVKWLDTEIERGSK